MDPQNSTSNINIIDKIGYFLDSPYQNKLVQFVTYITNSCQANLKALKQPSQTFWTKILTPYFFLQ